MSKKFISILGTGNYQSCTYYLGENKAKPTQFIQEALIELLCSGWSKEDKAIILLTEGARSINWNNEHNENKRLKQNILNR